MRKLLNTLYVTTEEAYLKLDGENVVVVKDEAEIGRFPLHILSGIVMFTWAGASPALMGKCAANGVNLSFCTPWGKYLCHTVGKNNGNVLLRREQYRIADDAEKSMSYSRNFIFGKVYNSRKVLDRMVRDHGDRVDTDRFRAISQELKSDLQQIKCAENKDMLLGYEGTSARRYFSIFGDMILSESVDFSFVERNRRPPKDIVNALLSFAYSILTNEVVSALECVGLDAYVGFMHTDRPGRASLALDMVEELRPCFADRFVCTLINNRILDKKDFNISELGSVTLNEKGRKLFLQKWQERKKVEIKHPFLGETVPWGLVLHVQALLLSRVIRGDLDVYPPFCWR